MFLLRPDEATRALARQRVVVHDFPDGRLEIRHQGRPLPYVTFDKLQQVPQGSVVANKNLDAAVAAVRAEQGRTADGALSAEGTRSAHTVPVEGDRLGAALAHVRVMQSQTERKRTTSAPRRRGQVGHMFKVG